MYTIVISENILNKHKDYILQSDILNKILELKKNSDFEEEYGKEHILFCDFIITQINNLNNIDILKEENIFLSKPRILNKYWSYVNILDTKSQTFLCCTSS